MSTPTVAQPPSEVHPIRAEHLVQVLWLRDRHPLMQYAAVCPDDEVAWRLFRRVSDVLKALVNVEGQRQGGLR